MEKTLFQKIIDKEIPAEFVFEDERCIAVGYLSQSSNSLFSDSRKAIQAWKTCKRTEISLLISSLSAANSPEITVRRLPSQFNVGEKGGRDFHLHLP